MSEIRQATILVRDRNVSGGPLPSNTIMAEPFVNTFDGILKFSGTTGGGFEPSDTVSVFEVGSRLHNSKIINRLSINDNFIVTGNTGVISTYEGVSGSGLTGKFLSGTTDGFILSDISDIIGTQDITRVGQGSNIVTGGTENDPIVSVVDSPSFNESSFSGNVSITNGGVIISGSTDLYGIFQLDGDVPYLQDGLNTVTGGTINFPQINLIGSPIFSGTVSASGFTNNNATDGRVVYVGTGGTYVDEAGFEYDAAADKLMIKNIQIGDPSSIGTTTTIFGDLVIIGNAFSANTSELYIEDNKIELNFNPSASTIATSIESGFLIQDGAGIVGNDVFFDIRGTAIGVASRSFATNLNDIRIRETGTGASPNGVRLIGEFDIIDGGSF